MRRVVLWLCVLVPFLLGYLVGVMVKIWRFLVAAFIEGYKVAMR